VASTPGAVLGTSSGERASVYSLSIRYTLYVYIEGVSYREEGVHIDDLPCQMHTLCIRLQTGICVCIATPPGKIRTVYVWHILQGGARPQ
jgi:hypothetical protein